MSIDLKNTAGLMAIELGGELLKAGASHILLPYIHQRLLGGSVKRRVPIRRLKKQKAKPR